MKRALFLMIGCLVGQLMIANPITKEEAQQKAVQFLSKKQSNRALAPRLKPVSLQEVSGLNSERLYAFNVGQKNGFVVMSADDCTGELILGYADKGELSMETMPDNMRAWLKGYDDEIKWMQEHGVTNQVAASRAMTASAARTPISPLLASQWDQDEPYNTYCPSGTVTGCVATATAQVLYYYGKKRSTSTTTLKAIPAYTTTAHGYSVSEKPVRTFNWSKMSDTYPSTSEANEEVARLMEYVGAGLQMDYGPASSGGSMAFSNDIPYVLTEYFGYDKSARCVYRNDYSYGEWIDMMYKMLSNGDPVLYGGDSTGGGHSFVLDGYTEDDYFHVNWGWSGNSDGHFKLSVLYSKQQGIGGSTSQDGYSSAQDAIINLKPVSTSTVNPIRMTVSGVYVSADPPATSATYHRASASENFTSVDLGFDIYNYTGATRSFNFGWGIYETGALLASSTVDDLPKGYGYTGSYFTCTFGAGIPDGEYTLLPVSKEKGTETWLPDYDSEIHYIKATISGTTLTLTPSKVVKLSVSSLSVSGSPTAGSPITVTANVTNKGTLYSGDLSINYNAGTNDTPIYRKLAAQQVEIAPEETKEVTFTFTINSTVENLGLYLLDKRNSVIASTTLTVAASSGATTGTLTIDEENGITLEHAAGAKWYNGFYGSKLQGHVTVKNTSTTNAHTSGLLIRLWKNYSGNQYTLWDSHTCATNIDANGGTQTFDFVFDELEVGTKYFLSYHYTNGAELLNDLEKPQVTHYSMQAYYGVTTYGADGTETTVAPTATVTTPASALALDISGLNTVTTVTPNANPNTLYIVGSSVPSGLDGKNVIKNGTAETLTLSDGNGFYAPINFTATEVSYTRTFTNGADGSNGWNTIVLPFDVTQVKQGDKVIDWFHSSSDTGKHFWVKNFSSEDGTTVNFNYVEQMKANTPYIIAVPGNTWGANWDLTDKKITFYGANANIEADALASVSGNSYKFAGTMQNKAVTDCYVMNTDGNAFEKTSTTVAPFRAYFSPQAMIPGQTAAASLHIGSEGNNPTGITEMTYDRQETKGAAYNLNGQRVAHPRKGLYIVDGKKVIMK